MDVDDFKVLTKKEPKKDTQKSINFNTGEVWNKLWKRKRLQINFFNNSWTLLSAAERKIHGLKLLSCKTVPLPFHDWNERICKECYNPNSVSRIVDNRNKILDIVNNYKYMSFNFGPTLLSWMEEFAPLYLGKNYQSRY